MDRFYFDEKEGKTDDWAAKMMRQHGWYAHFVPGDEDFPNSINYHTHGVERSFGHADLQICFPIPPDTCHQIFSLVVDNIKEGARYLPGVQYPDIIDNDLKVAFIEAMECGRQVLRLIFPDKNGAYEGQIYQSQFGGGTDQGGAI